MPWEEPARQRSEDRWPELLQVASDVIGMKGYWAASLQDIAERMGLLKGSVYHYARTKEDLLFAILLEGHEKSLASVEAHGEIVATIKGPLILSLIDAWMTSIQNLKFPAMGANSFDYLRFLTREHRARIRSIRLSISQYVAGLIQTDIERGYLTRDCDPAVLADALIVMMNSSHEWVRDRPSEWNEVRSLYKWIAMRGILCREGSYSDAPQVSGRLKPPARGTAVLRAVMDDQGRGERWDELVRVAAEVFTERTYTGASLSEIARRFGVRKASLYHYITNKEDLFYEIQLRAHQRALSIVEAPISDPEVPADQRLKEFIVAFATMVSTHDSPYVLLGLPDMTYLSEEHAVIIRSMRRRIRRYLSDLLRKGVEQGLLEPQLKVPHLTNVLFMSLNRSTRWFRPSEGGPSLADWHLQLFMEGLATPSWRDLPLG